MKRLKLNPGQTLIGVYRGRWKVGRDKTSLLVERIIGKRVELCYVEHAAFDHLMLYQYLEEVPIGATVFLKCEGLTKTSQGPVRRYTVEYNDWMKEILK